MTNASAGCCVDDHLLCGHFSSCSRMVLNVSIPADHGVLGHLATVKEAAPISRPEAAPRRQTLCAKEYRRGRVPRYRGAASPPEAGRWVTEPDEDLRE